MESKEATDWAIQVYNGNYKDYWSTDYCFWFQCSLKDYALAGFPKGESLIGIGQWNKENGTSYKGE